MSTQYRLVQSGKTASGSCSAGQGSSESVAPRIYLLMKYELIFWSNPSYSKIIFALQKRTVRIMSGAKPRKSCRSLFMTLKVLPLPQEYIFLLMNFIVYNQEHFNTSSAIHRANSALL
jgi:hypothetical protein